MLIDTKRRIPTPSPDILPRPDLDSALTTGARCRLVVVSAPTGFGQTTLLCQYAAGLLAKGTAVGWLSVDTPDDDPRRFLNYFGAAMRHRMGPIGIGTIRPGLQPTPHQDHVFQTLGGDKAKPPPVLDRSVFNMPVPE